MLTFSTLTDGAVGLGLIVSLLFAALIAGHLYADAHRNDQ